MACLQDDAVFDEFPDLKLTFQVSIFCYIPWKFSGEFQQMSISMNKMFGISFIKLKFPWHFQPPSSTALCLGELCLSIFGALRKKSTQAWKFDLHSNHCNFLRKINNRKTWSLSYKEGPMPPRLLLPPLVCRSPTKEHHHRQLIDLIFSSSLTSLVLLLPTHGHDYNYMWRRWEKSFAAFGQITTLRLHR